MISAKPKAGSAIPQGALLEGASSYPDFVINPILTNLSDIGEYFCKYLCRLCCSTQLAGERGIIIYDRNVGISCGQQPGNLFLQMRDLIEIKNENGYFERVRKHGRIRNARFRVLLGPS